MKKFFYFDLGNVLVHFSHERACRQLALVLNTQPETVRAIVFDGGLQERLETGLISNREFCQSLNRHFGTNVDDESIVHAASDIFWLNDEIFPFVERVRSSGWATGILSNTCAAHWEFVSRGILAGHLKLFDECVLSFEVKAMKPTPAIYAFAAAKAGVAASAIHFIDDRLENVVAAQKFGFAAWQFTTIKDFEIIFEPCFNS